MVNNMTDLTAQEPAWQTRDHLDDPVIGELRNRLRSSAVSILGSMIFTINTSQSNIMRMQFAGISCCRTTASRGISFSITGAILR